jgi:PAS domain S-box-containing protein
LTDAVAQSIVVLNPDGKAIYANRVALEYTGLSLEEVQAAGFRERVFHPDDVTRLRETRLDALSGTRPFENEQRVLRADGQYRWFLIQYNPVVDDDGRVACWYATGTDIEDRKRAENRLRQDERELRQLMDALPQHVLVLDKDGALLQANRTMLDYKGYTLEEMKSVGTRERIDRDVHPDDLDKVQQERRSGLSNGVPFEMEKRLLGKDASFAGSCFATTQSWTKAETWCGGSPPPPTSKNASRPKIACETKPSRCVKRSSDRRCTKRLSVHLPRFAAS